MWQAPSRIRYPGILACDLDRIVLRRTVSEGGVLQSRLQSIEGLRVQKRVCVKCKKKFRLDEMEGDHTKPWHEGGKTNAENCQMLCKADNRAKSGK